MLLLIQIQIQSKCTRPIRAKHGSAAWCYDKTFELYVCLTHAYDENPANFSLQSTNVGHRHNLYYIEQYISLIEVTKFPSPPSSHVLSYYNMHAKCIQIDRNLVLSIFFSWFFKGPNEWMLVWKKGRIGEYDSERGKRMRPKKVIHTTAECAV